MARRNLKSITQMGSGKMIYRIIVSAAILIAGFVLRAVVGSSIRKKVEAQVLKPHSGLLAHKISTVFFVVAVVLAVGFVWGTSPKNIWISVASIVALTAIAFFGVWSLVSNVVAGLILLIARPLDIGDEVVLLPEDIQCTVTNITGIFLVLRDREGAVITIPNNFVFQRIIKKVKKQNGT